MKTGKLLRAFQLISLLSAEELDFFSAFLQNKAWNSSALVSRVFDLIRPYHPDFQQTEGLKESIWEQLYPGKPFNDPWMRQIFMHLANKTETFIGLLHVHSNIGLMEIETGEGLFNRQAPTLLHSFLNKTRGRLLTEAELNDSGYWSYYRLELLEERLEEQKAQKEFRSKPINHSASAFHLDCFYLINKLRQMVGLVNFRNITGVGYDLHLTEMALESASNKPFAEITGIAIYRNCYLMLTGEKPEEGFQELVRLLREHPGLYPPPESRRLFGMAQNFCIRMINSGNQEFFKELFSIYKALLQSRLILENERLSPWDFKNITTTGLRLKEFAWVLQFIGEYKSQIEEQYRENAEHYNLANYYFHQGEFDRVAGLLAKVQFNDVFYSLDTRVLLVKTWYETDEYDALISLTESFTIFLNRNKQLSPDHRKLYLNFIRMVKRLMNAVRGDKKGLDKLKEEIQQTRLLADKAWLLSKIQEWG